MDETQRATDISPPMPDAVAASAAPTRFSPAPSSNPPLAQPPTPPLAYPVTSGVLLAVVVVFSLALGLAWLDGRNTQQRLREDVARRLTDADAAFAQSKARDSEAANELREAQAKLALLETRLAESQSQQASLEALYRELAPSRDELALTEIEQVLLLAGQQLALAGNVQAAVAALQLADAKLARIDRPQLTPLRRALARDLDRLKAVPFVDIAGMGLKLDQVLATIDMLPLARDERVPEPTPPPAASDEPPWRAWWRETWAELRSLVRIEISDKPQAPLVMPAEQYFLRENLRLKLLAARIALLAREVDFKADVTTANAWLKQYFDTRTKSVQTVVATLTQLAATPMPAELPDVSRSLDAVRAYKSARERGDSTVSRPQNMGASRRSETNSSRQPALR